MKHKDYKLLFISILNNKTWQLEFSKYSLSVSIVSIALICLMSLLLIIFSIPIVNEYLEINTVNHKINAQKEIINNLSDSLDEIGLMKSYIENIVGLEEGEELDPSKIRFMITDNIPNIKPNEGIISDEFDIDSKHFGIDIVNEEGTSIFSVANGIVIYSDYSKNYGNVIIIDHENGYYSHYYHNKENFVKRNERVDAGTVIAQLGNTGQKSSGPHLHFEIWKDGEPINPLSFFQNYLKKSDKLEAENDE
tara:strand:+ start:1006 stop:1755 length:750 start_codon:yes stop_codon:yes gene_type:complete